MHHSDKPPWDGYFRPYCIKNLRYTHVLSQILLFVLNKTISFHGATQFCESRFVLQRRQKMKKYRRISRLFVYAAERRCLAKPMSHCGALPCPAFFVVYKPTFHGVSLPVPFLCYFFFRKEKVAQKEDTEGACPLRIPRLMSDTMLTAVSDPDAPPSLPRGSSFCALFGRI